jgi:SAM-dependent methyltransferase
VSLVAVGGEDEVVDLGCGTGANLRHLAPLLAKAGARRQRWTCIDRDVALLRCLPGRTADWAAASGIAARETAAGVGLDGPGWHCEARVRRDDLAARAPEFPEGGLVTASALLDLVSARWLEALLRSCHRSRCRTLLVLSYDGRCGLHPSHPDDDLVIDALNRHQRTDKGFGAALGPGAADFAETLCRELGYQVRVAASDWRVGSGEGGLQRALLEGWERAATALHRDQRSRLRDWRSARERWVDNGESTLLVGHRDLAAWPREAGASAAARARRR